MVILRQATIKYKEYDPNSLTKGSNKRICVSCDKCGRVRYIQYFQYRDLCFNCGKIGINQGKNNPMFGKRGKGVGMYGKHHSDESKEKNRIAHLGKKLSDEHKANISKNNGRGFLGKHHTLESIQKIITTRGDTSGKNNNNWKGGFDISRPWVLPESRCIKLNSRFEKSEFHHITKSVGIFIPKYLHKTNHHDLKNNKDMDKINKIALQYLTGDY